MLWECRQLLNQMSNCFFWNTSFVVFLENLFLKIVPDKTSTLQYFSFSKTVEMYV